MAPTPTHQRRPFRFGVVAENCHDAARWTETARRAEAFGYDALLVRDHFVSDFFGPQLAPFTSLAFAAAVTTTLRVGTLVIDNDYRHPVVLAKEAATLDHLSGGRFELGIGAGWLRDEYRKAGLAYDRAGVRIDRLEEALPLLDRWLRGETVTAHGTHYQVTDLDVFPRAVQLPRPPLLIGANAPRMLRLAGRHADIVGIMNTSVASGEVRVDPREFTPNAVQRRVALVAEGAGDRFSQIELSQVADVIVSEDRTATATRRAQLKGWDGITAADVLEMPGVYIGTVDQIAADAMARRERYGFSYLMVDDSQLDAFAPVIAALEGR